jgi:hypothetical protein
LPEIVTFSGNFRIYYYINQKHNKMENTIWCNISKNTMLNAFVDTEERIFVEHPSNKNVIIRISPMNILESI